jgi:hypothetical protein
MVGRIVACPFVNERSEGLSRDLVRRRGCDRARRIAPTSEQRGEGAMFVHETRKIVLAFCVRRTREVILTPRAADFYLARKKADLG